jgi:hypothetical protein
VEAAKNTLAAVVLVEAGLLIGLPVYKVPPSRKTTPTPATTLPSIGKGMTMASAEKLATEKDTDASLKVYVAYYCLHVLYTPQKPHTRNVAPHRTK